VYKDFKKGVQVVRHGNFAKYWSVTIYMYVGYLFFLDCSIEAAHYMKIGMLDAVHEKEVSDS
jgi:hypothetical protein